MKKELSIFFTALMYYTRIPCPRWVGHEEGALNQATRYFPFIGWLVGGVASLVLIAFSYLFSPSLGILFSMAATVLLTGAFHEDGFADMCDGFGGGWTKEKIMLIMKDSRVGTYGVVGLGLLLAVKFFALEQLLRFFPQDQPQILLLIFITAHALSRFTAATFIFTHPYSRESEDSKAKPVAQALSSINLAIAALFALAPLLGLILLTNQPFFIAILLPLYLLKAYLGSYFSRWIGGYTGDCLGATQQLAEVLIYLSLILLWKFT
jgi:adenosylcobinamide-GDP ribazoletransferase